jgi:hypothetical protein
MDDPLWVSMDIPADVANEETMMAVQRELVIQLKRLADREMECGELAIIPMKRGAFALPGCANALSGCAMEDADVYCVLLQEAPREG